MWQELIIGFLFLLALFYLGKLAYRQFSKKESCGDGCGCSSASKISLDDIERKLKADKRFQK